MQKKNSTKQSAPKPRSLTLRQRAQTIVNNRRRYDADTRQAIRHALRESHADLAECVRRAERGETIIDLTAEQARANAATLQTAANAPGHAELAAHIAAVLAHPLTPTDIYNALGEAVCGLDAPRGYFNRASYIEMCLREDAEANRKGGA